ncbi:hypothetical protein K438DRAFT_1845774 [Mycena galopus ATCC 62051]|nr:hypothetical protein K438DRAFT_1845774 [Mycena galopus ATCC 62051]
MGRVWALTSSASAAGVGGDVRSAVRSFKDCTALPAFLVLLSLCSFCMRICVPAIISQRPPAVILGMNEWVENLEPIFGVQAQALHTLYSFLLFCVSIIC